MLLNKNPARLAQSVERQTLISALERVCDLKAAGSTPASGYSYNAND